MNKIAQVSIVRFAVLGIAGVALAGCAASTPTIDTSPGAEVTFDGLYPVSGGRMDAAWARSDFSVSSYSKIMLESIGIEYRPGGETRRAPYGSASSDHYEMTADQKERFRALMREVLLEELGKGKNYQIVSAPGPDVLTVRVGLLDVASFVPKEPIGNADIYLSRVGEATLVLELRDSNTDAILLRGVDRRAAEDPSDRLRESNRPMNTAEVRRLARTWAILIRDGLDHYMAPPATAAE